MNDSDALTVTMTAAEWNRALALIGKAPYEVCADIIGKIHRQCLDQQPPLPTAKPNGEDAHAPN